MGKFKVGDWVRVTGLANGAPVECLGLEGCVYKLYDGGFYVEFDREVGGSNKWWFDQNEIVSAGDNVNSPAHYQSENGIECIDAIRAQLTADEFRGYIKGNIAKYVWRERTKGGDESLRKAKWYLEYLLKALSENTAV